MGEIIQSSIHAVPYLVGALVLWPLLSVARRRFIMAALLSEGKIDDLLAPLVFKILRLSLVLVTLVFILRAYKIDVAPLTAFLSIFGMAMGFASKEFLGSVVSMFVILFNRRFDIGDNIKVAGHEGTVVKVGLCVTLRTQGPNGPVMISIPNSKIANSILEVG